MRRISLIVTLLVLLSAFAEAQQKGRVLVWNQPDHLEPPFATQLRKVALVLEVVCGDGHGKPLTSSEGKPLVMGGTAFVVGYHDPRLPKDSRFDYLVTNRHVAECWDDDTLKPREVLARVLKANVKNGEAQPFSLAVDWKFPPDDSADLAAAIVRLPENVESAWVPLDLFFSKESFADDNLGEGAKIILAGFFVQLQGEKRVQPLLREGILSMIPDEPLLTTALKRGPLYLADVHVFGGYSGSPVFINVSRPEKLQLTDDYRFLGVVSGYYYEDSEFKLQIATTAQGKIHNNSGVSMIVPADILKDLILNDSDFKKDRDRYFATNPTTLSPSK